MLGSTERLNRQWFWFKSSQKMGPQLSLISQTDDRTGDPEYKAVNKQIYQLLHTNKSLTTSF